MERATFIQEQIRHRLGEWSGSRRIVSSALAEILEYNSRKGLCTSRIEETDAFDIYFLLLDFEATYSDWIKERYNLFISYLSRFTKPATQLKKLPLFAVLHDSYIQFLPPHLEKQIPVLCFARPTYLQFSAITFTGYPREYTFRNDALPDYSYINFEQKIGKAIYRGSLNENIFTDKRYVPIAEMIKCQDSPDEILSVLRQTTRFQLVEKFFQHPLFDVRLTNFNSMPGALLPNALCWILNYFVDRLTPEEMTSYKYLIYADGYGYSDALFWMLASNSLVLAFPFKHHGPLHGHLKPGVHYVPISEDLSDLEEKVQWCETNQESCKTIISNANKLMELFRCEDLEQEITYGVLKSLSQLQ